MTRPLADAEWRRTWDDGYSRLTISREDNGRVLIGVTDIKADGYAASFNREIADEIAEFIKGGDR